MRLIKYLLHRPTWQKLPVLPRMYSSDFQKADVDADTETLMRLTHTRCPQGVEVLKKRHGAKTSKQLIETLPPRRYKRRIRRLMLGIVQRAFGLLPYDPMRSIARQHMRRSRRGA